MKWENWQKSSRLPPQELKIYIQQFSYMISMISTLIVPRTTILATFKKSTDLNSEKKNKCWQIYIKIRKLKEINLVVTLRAENLYSVIFIYDKHDFDIDSTQNDHFSDF